MTVPSTDPTTPPDWLRWTLRFAVVLPIMVAVTRALATGWFPVGDSALLAIRASDVGTEHHPLLGSWTSASLTLGTDVNNPGPLYLDLLAPFQWTVGRWFGIGPAVAIGVGLVNAGFASLTAWVGHLLGGWRVERWALLTVAALTWAMGSELLIDIWQPHALLLPFTTMLFLTAGLLSGCWRLVPLWLGTMSLIVQNHIGYVYVLVVLTAVVFVAGLAAIRAHDADVVTLLRTRTSAWAAGVVAIVWLQPIGEQLFGAGTGNLARLASNASGGDVTIGAGTAVKLSARVVSLPTWWTRFGFADAVESTPLTDTPTGPQLMVAGLPSGPVALLAILVTLGAIGTVGWAAHRRGEYLIRSVMIVAFVGVATAVATLSIQTVSIVGLGSHHVRWLWVLSLFVQVGVLWSIVELGWLNRVAAHVDRGVAATVVALTLANLGFHAHDLGPTADRAASDTLERTFSDLERFSPDGPVLYDVGNLRPFEPWSSAVKMRLRELDIEFRVDDEGVVRQFGNRRRADGSEVTVVRQIERGAALVYTGPGCVLSVASPFDAGDEERIDALIAAAVDDVAGGRAELGLEGLEPDLAARFERAIDGDTDEAFVLVADGLLPFLAAEQRIVRSTPAVDALLADHGDVTRRVEGTLMLVADPPVGCPR